MSRHRLPLVFASLLLIVSFPLGAQTRPGATVSPAAKKAVSAAAKPGAKPAPAGSASPTGTAHLPATEPARWSVLAHGGGQVPAFVVGSWRALADGSLDRRQFQEFSPPDVVAALGLATVYEPDTAGWFLSAGPRAIVKTTDAKAGYPVRSYESWAGLGWAVGVTSGSATAARMSWECNADKPIEFSDLLRKAVTEAPGAGAWIVAGQVELAAARGQSLARSPVPGGLNASSDQKDPERSWSKPVEDHHRMALVTAVVVAPESPVGRQLAERFLPPDAPALAAGEAQCFWLAHYALFQSDTPPRIDTSRPFQALWPNALDGTRKAPLFETVRRVLDGTTVASAHLSVWAIGSLTGYPLFENPDLVDPTQLDSTIIGDQGWARANTLFKEPIYDRPRLLLRRAAAEGIVRVNKRLAAKGYRLKLWDAYRPLSVTQMLSVRFPGNSGKYLASPTLGSRHNRGAAVDCTLTDMDGNEVEMPSPYLTFDAQAGRDRPMSATARKHLNVLTDAMTAERFTTIQSEWWHYDAPGWTHYRVLNQPLWPEDESTPPAAPPALALPLAARPGN